MTRLVKAALLAALAVPAAMSLTACICCCKP